MVKITWHNALRYITSTWSKEEAQPVLPCTVPCQFIIGAFLDSTSLWKHWGLMDDYVQRSTSLLLGMKTIFKFTVLLTTFLWILFYRSLSTSLINISFEVYFLCFYSRLIFIFHETKLQFHNNSYGFISFFYWFFFYPTFTTKNHKALWCFSVLYFP